MSRSLFAPCLLVLAIVACGPSVREDDDIDPNAPCDPGDTVTCYTGMDGTKGVGPCKAGKRTCGAGGTWGNCDGEIVPAAESCTDQIDNNCNGETDEDADKDLDGVTTCGGDCCDSTECSRPELVNQGAFDAPGNGVDDDCNGTVDDTLLLCDQGLPSNPTDGMEYAKAIDLCQTTTMGDKKWGVISASLNLADGSGAAATKAHSIRSRFGSGVTPKGGVSFALLSTGAAAGQGDTNPNFEDFQNTPNFNGNGTQSAFPADFVAANNGSLPNTPGCPEPSGNTANDPVMLTLTIKVPTNAKSFKLDTNFFSSEFPEYTCSPFNDFFVVLLDSAYNGAPSNPTDKNLAFFQPMGSSMKYPVGVNLASGNTGLFTQCINGSTGCSGTPGSINTCLGTEQLAGTGMDTSDPGNCDSNSLQGGGTGWLQTSGNVLPGEIIKLRIAIWDTSDHILDSIAIVDAFTWSVEVAQPGTVIF